MRPRVALLTNIPAPYRLAFFRELSLLCDLNVVFDARSEPNRDWRVPDDLGFPHSYLSGFALAQKRRRSDGIPDDERYLQVRWNILPLLLKFRPDVVVSIEFGLRSLQAAAYCAVRKVPLIIWSEGTPHSEGWQRSMRRTIRRTLAALATRFWSNGSESSALLESYGAAARTIDTGMIGVSTVRLSGQVQQQLQRREQIRTELAVAGVVFLFSGQLIPRKGLRQFLDALLLTADRVREFSVVLLGDGCQRSIVEQWCAANPQFKVRVLGFVQPDEVAAVYAAADVFVMPTLDDNWSLVALEAAVAGLPQIFSRHNGATVDLARMQAPGSVVDPLDTGSFGAALRGFLDDRPARTGEAITASLIAYYGPEACSRRAYESIVAAIAGASGVVGQPHLCR